MDVRRRAENDPSRKVKTRQGYSPSHSGSQMSMGYHSLPDLNRTPSGSGASQTLSQFGPPGAGPRLARFHPYLIPGAPLESGSGSGSLEDFHIPRSRSPVLNQYLSVERGSTLSRVSSGSTDSITPSESASRNSSRSGDRRRSNARLPASDKLAIVPWNDATRRRFEQYIVRLTASAGFSLSWVENNVWHSFLDEFLPSAPKISRKVLTKRILPEAVKEVEDKIKKNVAGEEVTMQGDGWTGINNQHLLAFMITCDKKVSYLIR